MRLIDLRHLGHSRVIGSWLLGDVLIDPGPESCLAELLAGLDGQRPRVIALTHIHLDHAGGTGTLLQRFPDAEVWVHERGARHLIDPAKLLASAGRLYGAENMQRLWGQVLPVAAERVRRLAGGEVLDSSAGAHGGFRVAYTPGHASHHVAYLHEDSGTVFSGDVGGVRVGQGGAVLAPTPPPDVDLPLWRASLEQIEAWRPSAIAPTHFGRYEDVAEHIAQLRERLAEWERLAAAGDEAGFVAALQERFEVGDDPDAAGSYAQAMPADQSYAGMRRYLEKRDER
ncbi:MAG TPA: MBL fold metallo-hydrolase [Solirubrobacteraceae bacterium]|jgi:glyoxylase-like metal-dependent hydrolase (beta-lactamase superfamily II)|nr:MBL fold metallo-hydrolase [Solirubrobacteraceae bacterium]